MKPIVVGEFEPPKLPKKLLGGLFLASQVTQVQCDDDSTAVTQYEEKCEEGFVSAACCDGLGSLRGVGGSLWALPGSPGSKDCDRQGGHPDRAGEEREPGYVGAPGTACAC